MKLLIVDDDRVTRDLLKEVFEKDEYEVTACSSAEEAKEKIAKGRFPLILSDIRMVQMDGLALLSFVKKVSPSSVVTLMTGFGNMDGAIGAIQKGAFDYISKPFELPELKAVVARAKEHFEASAAVAHSAGAHSTPIAPRGLIGKSPKIVEVYKTLARATLSPSNVLIIGESGTGKELVARGIHENSPRKQKPFIAVNCGALAENLLESELFGHVRGAFTGAVGAKTGLVEEASGGTLFLDEIGDISPALQVKLLRVIQEGEFKPVGSNETKKVDVRFIAATHRNLDTSVQEGTFRDDLYYRLKVITIDIPPLRQRKSDIAELVQSFLVRFSEKMQKNISHTTPEAMHLLSNYSWPGNVRELEHAIEHAIAMTRTTVLYPEDFPAEIRSTDKAVSFSYSDPSSETSQASLEEIEKQHIQKILQENGYNQSRTAAALGIDRKTLYRKAQRYGLSLRHEKP